MWPRVSVITLTHNKLDCTRRCLSSLLGTAFSPWELVVVDNGSSDGTRDWLLRFAETAARAGVEVATLFNDGNIGCSTARNQGLARARGEKVVFVDNDVALRARGWLSRLSETLDSSPDAGVVGPKLVYPFMPYDIQCAGAAVSPSGRVQFMGRGERREDPRFNARREVQCLISACFMADRKAVVEAGGFDEAFNPVEYEDIDLCYRLRSRGSRCLYEPAVEMYHFESMTTAGTPALPNTYLIVKNGLLFKQRWRHMFGNEGGPPDEATRWRTVATRGLASVGDLPLTE